MGRRPHVWTDRMIELLGTDTDYEVGKKIGYSATSVFHKRKALGIPSAKETEIAERKKNKKPRPSSNERMLNKYPGIEKHLASKNNNIVADIYGISRERVRQIRNQLNVPRPKHNIHSKLSDVDQAFIKENIGKMPDTQLARMFSVNQTSIRKYRVSLGIPTYSEFVRARKDDLIREHIQRVGVDSDSQIALDIDGVRQNDVYRFRKKAGIKADPKNSRRWNRPLDSETRDFMLSKLYNDGYTDKQISQQLGYAESTIQVLRSQLGLVKYKRKARGDKRESCEDDAPVCRADDEAV